MHEIFSFNSYKKYISSKLVRGEAKKFAHYINCQPSFLSRVLKEEINLSLEQGILVNEYFQHSLAETEFFMCMLHYARAGSKKLEEYYSKQMALMNSERERLQKKLNTSHEVSSAFKMEYYSSAFYALAHILASVPHLNQIEEIAKILKISVREAKAILSDLVRFGLLKQKIHARKDEIYSTLHNRNMRSWILGQMQKNNPLNYHFTNVIGLSIKDFNQIINLLSNTTQRIDEIVAPSTEECAAVICIDATILEK